MTRSLAGVNNSLSVSREVNRVIIQKLNAPSVIINVVTIQKNNKAPGANQIPNRLLKQLPEAVITRLTEIYKLHLYQVGIFPEQLGKRYGDHYMQTRKTSTPT